MSSVDIVFELCAGIRTKQSNAATVCVCVCVCHGLNSDTRNFNCWWRWTADHNLVDCFELHTLRLKTLDSEIWR